MEITKPGNLVNGGTNTEIQVFSLLLQSPSNRSHCLSRLRLINVLLHVNLLFLITITKTCNHRLVPNRKGVHQGYISSPRLFNLFAECIVWIARLDDAQAGIKISGRNINNLRYADDTTLMAGSEEELKSLLMKVKESEKVGLRLNIQKTKIMASGPITSWQIHGESMETVIDFIFSGSKITADGDCSHEIKRCLLLERKATTNLDSILKSRDITLPTNVCLVKIMVFPVVMYGCKNWTIKKAECRRIDAFELWCWRRLLRVP